MPKFIHDTVVPFKDSDMNKKQQVADMFNRIAFRYDFMNRFLSGGIDLRWRKKAIAELKGSHPQILLDVATGTGDVAILAMQILRPRKIIGIDISEGMLELGRKKIQSLHLSEIIELQTGDSEALQFPDHYFDAITVAFGVRNFENLEKGLKEMLRVLKPGGKLVVLEFSKPRNSIFRALCNIYTRIIAPGIGSIVSRNAAAYSYLHESVNAFPEGNNFLSIFNAAGYKSVYLKSLSLGICTVYCGIK